MTRLVRLTAAAWLGGVVAAMAGAQTVPVFQAKVGETTFTMVGGAPEKGGSTTVPVVLVPVRLEFAAGGVGAAGAGAVLDARGDVTRVVGSPLFGRFAWPASGGGERTQYGDALLRATFGAGTGVGAAGAVPGSAKPMAGAGWHVLLGKPAVRPVTVTVPVGRGYVLRSGLQKGAAGVRVMAVADEEYVQREVMRQVGAQPGKLVMAVVRNTAFYTMGDATVCCSWGAHGVDSAGTAEEKGGGTGNSFVLATVLKSAPNVVTDADVQPLTEQVAEFLMDPLHDTTEHGSSRNPAPGNVVPAWRRPGMERCAGSGIGSQYFDLEPTDENPKNNFPAGKAYRVGEGAEAYTVANVALLGWYTGTAPGLGGGLSFPDAGALTEPAVACPARQAHNAEAAPPVPTGTAVAKSAATNGHALIGYTNGREVAPPQWDVVILSFATPSKVAGAVPGTMVFEAPRGMDEATFRANLKAMKAQGQKVMVSLGGGGEAFTFADEARVQPFVDSVAKMVTDWGFDGIDIDLESPAMNLDPGDTDPRHPTTPSTVHLLEAMKQLKQRFGPGFMISLVPEGTQTPGGYPSYGGQYGSYLPLVVGLGDALTFVDTQSYNTPPLQGLDGEIYQPGTVDYHAAMTELLLQGFAVGGEPKRMFAAVPENKVAVGFWTQDTTPDVVTATMRYLVTGVAPAGVTYKLRRPGGYPGLLGAMFWNIDEDRDADYRFSNVVGPELHGFAAAK